MIYEKATAEVILFDNSDVIRTSGGDCKNHGHEIVESKCNNGPHESHAGKMTRDTARPR